MKKKLLCLLAALLLLTAGSRAFFVCPQDHILPPAFPKMLCGPIWVIPAQPAEEPQPGRYAELAKDLTEEERGLLALAVYHEVRGESEECQKACCEVILNRVLDERFPDTVKEVLYAPGQFSTAKLLTTQPVKEPAALAAAFRIVGEVLEETEYQLEGSYVFFATSKVNGDNFILLDRTYFSE